MFNRSCIALLVAAALLAGCRGGSGINAVPSAFQAAHTIGSAGSVAFNPIGPTHMSDGFPTSGKVNAVAVNPTNSKIIYVASGRGTGLETYSSAGLLGSTDGGSSWQPLTNGLTDSSGNIVSVVDSLWIDSANPSVLLAASEYDGIFRTTDGGSSWTNVYPSAQATQFALFNKVLYATSDAGILASKDDGKTWSVELHGNAKGHPTALGAVDGTSGSALYAGLSNGYFYTLAGGKWTRVGRLPFNKNTGTEGSSRMVHQIAVDPFKPATVYVSTNDGVWDQNLFGSTDGGKTWTAILSGSYYGFGLGTQAIAFSQVHRHRLYVGADGAFYYIPGDGSANPPVNGAANLKIIDLRDIWTAANGGDDACWVASDQGLDYTPTCSGGSYNDTVVSASASTGLARRFTVSPDGKTLLVSLQDFDSHFTSNGGSSWSLQPLYEDGFNELRPGDPSACYAYDEASGLSISTNGCASFSGGNSTIAPSRIMTTPIAFDPKNTKIMYLTSGPIPGPGLYGPKGIFKSTDGGATVTKLTWPFTWPGAVVVDQKNGPHILVCDINNGKSSLSVTTDGGKTWTKSTGVPPTQFWYAMTISPVNPKTVLASSMDAKNNVFVLRSTDGGKTFKKISVVTNAPLIFGRAGVERHDLIRIRGERVRRREAGEEGQAFVYSPEREIKYDQDVTKGTPDVVITTLRGAYLSTDDGQKWQRLDTGLIAHSFWGIRWVNGYVYLGSDGQGVVKSTGPLQSVRR
ncbi:MAG TPA: hypothetical protein VIW73_00580 [Candidatus Cybelea sp.]